MFKKLGFPVPRNFHRSEEKSRPGKIPCRVLGIQKQTMRASDHLDDYCQGFATARGEEVRVRGRACVVFRARSLTFPKQGDAPPGLVEVPELRAARIATANARAASLVAVKASDYWRELYVSALRQINDERDDAARFATLYVNACRDRDALGDTLRAVTDEARRDTEALHAENVWLKSQLRQLANHNAPGERERKRLHRGPHAGLP
jgi:hypothetical protein